MHQWFDAYGLWPAGNQLIFSIVVVLLGSILFILAGLLSLHLAAQAAVWLHGWEKPALPPAVLVRLEEQVRRLTSELDTRWPREVTIATPFFGLPNREECRKIQAAVSEEMRLQAEMRERQQAEAERQVSVTPVVSVLTQPAPEPSEAELERLTRPKGAPTDAQS